MSYRDDHERQLRQHEDRQNLPEDRRHDDFRSGYGGYDQQSAFSPSTTQQQGGGYERDWGHDYHRDFRDHGDYNAAARSRDATGADWGARRDNTRRFAESQYDANRRSAAGYSDWNRSWRNPNENAAARRGSGSDYDDYPSRTTGGYGYGSWDQDERWRDAPYSRRTGMGGSAYEQQGRGYGSSSGHSGPQGRQRHHDPDYHQWREEQIRNLDNDYDTWRQERYSKFSDEFSSWRNSRGQQQAQGTGSVTDNAKPRDTSGSASPSSRQQQQK